MSAIHQEQNLEVDDTSNLLLVDRLWKLKKVCEKRLFLYIQLNRLIKDVDYRHNLIRQARELNDTDINDLILDILDAEKASKRVSVPLKTISEAQPGNVSSTMPLRPRRSGRFYSFRNIMIPTLLIAIVACLGYIGYVLNENKQRMTAEASNSSVVSQPVVQQIPSKVETVPTPSLTYETFLHIHGSNSVGEKLLPAMLEKFLQAQQAEDLKWVQGDIDVERSLRFVGDQGTGQAIELHAHGTSTGFKGLESGVAEIAMASRAVKDEEWIRLLPLVGDMRTPQAEHIIGLDGLAIITHPSNPLNSITVEQLAAIFSGAITNWQTLGGGDQPISVFARDNNSGTWDTFKSLVLKPEGLGLEPTTKRLESSSDLSNQVAALPGAIGFVALPYVLDSKLLAVAASAESLPIRPTRFTISTEDYPLSRRLYIYTPSAHENPMIKDFVKFALSEPGQSVVEDLGLASQNIKLQKPPVLADAPTNYRQLTEQARRLSLNFRFKPASDDLDNKALRDLDRLVDFMAKHSEKSLMLFGFSDNLGEAQNNYLLSLNRAKTVERALHSRGIAPYKVLGFGEALPLASNNSVKGREKNRRVEAWLY